MKNTAKSSKIDIRGKKCPMTFVYTKIALENLEKDDILEVILDFPPAIKNVPNSCKIQGLADLIDLVQMKSDEKIWKLILKKL